MPTITDFSRVHIDYIDDNGNHHYISQRTQVQQKAGNALSTDASKPGRPARWKLRHVQCFNVTGGHTFRKRVVIASPANPLWTGASSAISGLDGVNWTVEGRIGEKRLVS
jgi:hypothetical protein